MLSPPSPQQIDLITMTSYINGYQVDTCSVYPQGLIPNVMGLSISVSSTIFVNQVYSLKFSVSLVDFINNANTFIIVFPTGSIITLVNLTSQITINNIQLVNGTNITFSQPATPARTSIPGNVLNFTFNNYTAPPSTLVTNNFTFGILKGGSFSQIGYATLQANPSNLTFTVIPLVSTINQNTTYQFTITITDAITSNGMLLITFPNTITLGFTSNSCASSTGTLMNPTPNCTKSGNSLYLSNLNSTTNNFTSTIFKINITGIINPPSTQPTSNFNVSSYYTNDINTLVSTRSNVFITATAGIMNSSLASISSTSYLVGNTGTSYTFTFSISNQIGINGYVTIGIPNVIVTAISSVGSYCFSQIFGASSFSATNCTGTSNSSFYFITFTNLFQVTSAPVNTVLKLQILSIFTNPPSTQIVNTFTISTFSAAGFIIDQLTSGLSLQMTTPANFLSISINPLSSVNSATTSYTFSFSQPSSITIGALLYIYFPS